jgi:hypothetical protein
MKLVRFKCIALLGALIFNGMAAFAQPAEEVTLHQDVDVRLPRIQIRPPVQQPVLKIYETLPDRLFMNVSAEPSYRLETNPYQAPRNTEPFTEATDAFRIQTTASLGYALTRKTRISANYFMLADRYDDFTPYHLDSTVQSAGINLEQDLLNGKRWVLRGAVQGRQLFLPDKRVNGDLMPSITYIQSIGRNGYLYANAAGVFARQGFFLGTGTKSTTWMGSIGTGYQIPYDQPKKLLKLLEGTSFSLSSTYSYTDVFNPRPYVSGYQQNIILTGEIAKQLNRHVPLQAFVRAEPVFNFGQERETIGISGVNFRLFGGLRASLRKSPLFRRDLNPQSNQQKATKS